MKAPAEVAAAVERRLRSTWAECLVTEARNEGRLARPEERGGLSAWPYDFPLGRMKSAELAGGFGVIPRQVSSWRTWAADHGVELLEGRRHVAGTEQTLPTHVRIVDIDTAAAVVGDGWSDKLVRGRSHAEVLTARFPSLVRPAKILAATDTYSDVDFGLLLDTADWFAAATAQERAALTPRQVPVEGLHTKWLNTRQGIVAELAGLEGRLGLLPPHPARIHFTYLDPDYRATGRRRHDSGSVGDTAALPYVPRLVLISENKDTAVGFPPVTGGVAVEGDGNGGGTHAAFDWIRNAPWVVYWGDMDARGLEILNEFRAAGVPATSLLMDMTAFTDWERFGTNRDPQDRLLGPKTPLPTEHLTDDEAELYRALTSPDWTRFRRIEQERIPLSVAHETVLRMAAGLDRRRSSTPTASHQKLTTL